MLDLVCGRQHALGEHFGIPLETSLTFAVAFAGFPEFPNLVPLAFLDERGRLGALEITLGSFSARDRGAA